MKNGVFAICGGKLSYRYSAIAVFLLVFLITSCIHSTPAIADLTRFQNGNFDDGFSGWNGNLFLFGDIDPALDPHFTLAAQGVQIGNDDFEFAVSLYQDFQMSSVSSATNKILLNFWLQWMPVDSGQALDIVATLFEYDPLSQQFGASLKSFVRHHDVGSLGRN
jgi:hypothetical protein